MSSIEKTFTIAGMSCGGCVNSLTRVLKAVPGIEPLKIEVGRAVLRSIPRSSPTKPSRPPSIRAGFSVVSEA